MDKFSIQGGWPLEGEVAVSGAKNSALPCLAASLLSAEPVKLRRIPKVRDIATMRRLLEHTGAVIEDTPDGAIQLHIPKVFKPEAPYELVKTMRASSLVLGPLLARTGTARVSMPGGCAIGARPINLHLTGLEVLGAEIRQDHGYIEAHAPKGLRGAVVTFDRITVTGTEDLMMAAVLAKGETMLVNAAREPYVVDLATLLNRMGAKIEGAGTSRIRIQGVTELHGADHTIAADPIETGTFLIAAAMAKGEVLITDCEPSDMTAITAKLRQAGVVIEERERALFVRGTAKLRAVDMTTEEHPGFVTDLQAPYMALMTQAEGISIVKENIFESRFTHVMELVRMGANIRIDGRQAIIAGPRSLSGAQVMASNLRDGAALILAGLVARGETVIDRVYHIDRGYENIDTKLAGLGARIERLQKKTNEETSADVVAAEAAQ